MTDVLDRVSAGDTFNPKDPKPPTKLLFFPQSFVIGTPVKAIPKGTIPSQIPEFEGKLDTFQTPIDWDGHVVKVYGPYRYTYTTKYGNLPNNARLHGYHVVADRENSVECKFRPSSFFKIESLSQFGYLSYGLVLGMNFRYNGQVSEPVYQLLKTNITRHHRGGRTFPYVVELTEEEMYKKIGNSQIETLYTGSLITSSDNPSKQLQVLNINDNWDVEKFLISAMDFSEGKIETHSLLDILQKFQVVDINSLISEMSEEIVD